MRLAALLHALLFLSQCEISAFGSDPVVIGSDTSGSQGGHACAEPDDARAAREEAPDSCASHCHIDVAAGTTDCDEITLGDPRTSLATIDMGHDDGVLITLEICDPTGLTFQIADSPTAHGGGGDDGSTSHDADIALDGTTLHLRAATGSGVDASNVNGFVASTGCSTRTIVLADQLAYLVESGAGLCGTAVLRINPPTDEHGTPDALWYLSTAGSVDGQTAGSGVRSAELCFY
jgi:hypothetical protein